MISPRSCALLLLLLVAGAARAEERRRVLVVPTELGGYFLERNQYRREINLALEERLRAAQFTAMRETLAAADADCREFGCLTRIANEHGADIVVAGRVVNNQQVKVSYHLRVRVVEKTAAKDVNKREREVDCDDCTEPQARDRLAQLMSAVLANESEGLTIPTFPSPEPRHSPPPSTEQYRDRFSPGERWGLRGAGLGALAVGIGFLAQGFVELHHNGDVVTKNGQEFRRNTSTTGQPLFFTVGAVATVAGVVLSALGWSNLKVRVTPEVTANGANLQLQGSF